MHKINHNWFTTDYNILKGITVYRNNVYNTIRIWNFFATVIFEHIKTAMYTYIILYTIHIILFF